MSEHQSQVRSFVKSAAVVIGLIVLLFFLWYALRVILILFVGILVAIPLSFLASFVKKYTGLAEGWAVSIVLLMLITSIWGMSRVLTPAFAQQLSELTQKVPEAFATLKAQFETQPWFKWIPLDGSEGQTLQADASTIFNRATGLVSSTISALFVVVIIFFVGIYLAINPELYTTGVLRLVPLKHRDRAREVLGALGYTLRRWMFGQFVSMSAVGILTTLGLWLLEVPLALGLGLLAFILDFVPNFGPLIAAAPAILMTLVDDPNKAMHVAILYLVVQQIEGLLITPFVHQKTVLLPPVLTIIAQVLVGLLAGPLGLLLATPLTAVTLVLVKMLYVEDTLGDEIDTPVEKLDTEELPPLPSKT